MRTILPLAAGSLLSILFACGDQANVVETGPTPPTAPSGEVDAGEPAAPPTATGPLFIDLGEVPLGEDATFDIPEGALGFNITAEGKLADFDPEAPFGIERITDPSGAIVHDHFMPKGGTKATSLASFDAIAAASVPQGEDVPQNLAGKWKVRFGLDGTPSNMKLRARVRVQSTSDGAFHGGQLDLHVHVPDGLKIGDRTVDASTAASDPDITKRIDTFFILTRELLGIEKGEVVIDQEAGSYQELDGIPEILEGFAISAGEKDGTQVLHVLMTNLIAIDGQPVAAGIAPGIPGAANVFGRNVSGIIVTTTTSPLVDAATMLHEAGHFFGLNHTTEVDGQSSDPLSDTPVCAGITADNIMDCPDRTNMMFVAGPIEGPATLSPTQTRVYRGSPIYRASTAGTGRTMSFEPPHSLPSFERSFRVSGKNTLSPVERELSFGFCGLAPLDANGLVKRHGRAQAISQLQAAAADHDLVPFIRGRANLALRALGAQ
jgi:hypothetical protein